MGIGVNRDVALKVLGDLERELLDQARNAARNHTLPPGKGAYALWVDRLEERLATIEALRALVGTMPANATLRRPPGEESDEVLERGHNVRGGGVEGGS